MARVAARDRNFLLVMFADGGVNSLRATEHFAHLCLHAFIHLDERRLGAFETFAGQFLRRVNAQLAAAAESAWGNT